MSSIRQQADIAIQELLDLVPDLKPYDIVVVGCSTSEVGGSCIGTNSSPDIAQALLDAFLPPCRERRLYLAVQCCEHLNRALVVEAACMERYGLTKVQVLPWLRAGGALSAGAMERFEAPVVVESLEAKAAAGIDIGGTFIGMHIRPVVVPLHIQHRKLGDANVTMARSRPKYIGGPRAHYPDPLQGY